jgi:hypothetical protein
MLESKAAWSTINFCVGCFYWILDCDILIFCEVFTTCGKHFYDTLDVFDFGQLH